MDIINVWFLAKLAFLFANILYLVFAVVVVRQVYLMTNTVQTGFEFQIRSLAWLHLFIAIGVFLLAIVLL